MVELNLSEVVFDNDFFVMDLPSDKQIVLNKIQETLYVDEDNAAEVNRVNVQLWDSRDGDINSITCSSVIGLQDTYTKITTDYPEYVGKLLNADNMQYCKVVIDD